MAVKKFYSTKAKAGWRFDGRKFWSYGYDIYLESGKRKRESGFGNKETAAAAARIKLAEKNLRYDLTDTRKFPLLSELFQKRIENVSEYEEQTRSNLKRFRQLPDNRAVAYGTTQTPTINQLTRLCPFWKSSPNPH